MTTSPRKPSSPKPKKLPPIADRQEVLELLTVASRNGHVPAMRLLLFELRADGVTEDDIPSVIDELARRREQAG